MDARSYLTKVSLSVDLSAVREAQQVLWDILDEAKKASLPATFIFSSRRFISMLRADMPNWSVTSK